MKPVPTSPHAAASARDIGALVLALGWEGPLIIWLGIRHDVTAEWLAGIVIALVVWRHIGQALREARRASRDKSIQAALR